MARFWCILRFLSHRHFCQQIAVKCRFLLPILSIVSRKYFFIFLIKSWNFINKNSTFNYSDIVNTFPEDKNIDESYKTEEIAGKKAPIETNTMMMKKWTMLFEDKQFHSQKEVGDDLNVCALTHQNLFKKKSKQRVKTFLKNCFIRNNLLWRFIIARIFEGLSDSSLKLLITVFHSQKHYLT